MPKLSVQLHNITPLFLNGAESKGSPEPRSASVRGQLRYWLRAVEGAKQPSLNQLWEKEKKLFGSTGGGSRVSVRFYAESDNRYRVHDGVEMLPHRSSNRSPQPAIEEDGQFKLDLVTRPGLSSQRTSSVSSACGCFWAALANAHGGCLVRLISNG